MMSCTPTPELLAPVGSEEMLHAAVRAGADAVYLGMQSFNARRNADNFDEETLVEAVEYCHLRSVRVYVTMNTLVLPGEMKSALRCAQICVNAGVDAFIVQDLGLFSQLRERHPEVELHVSTQMNIHSVDGVEACAALGASRITLARELALDEISHLSAQAHRLGVEIEAFAHGALCICYSGQCLMSSLIGGRSANRGLCAQACRLPYKLKDAHFPDKEIRTPGDHVLSPKDLCTISVIEDLIDAGVDSFKVEGRMKSPEYVYTTISVYRTALDRACKQEIPLHSDQFEQEAVQTLQSVFSRGFTSGYLKSDRSNTLMAYTRPNNRGENIGRVKSVRDGVMSFACDRELSSGDILEVWTSRGNVVVQIDAHVSQGKRGVHIPLGEDGKGIHQGDRIFRVRSAEASYEDDPRKPRIPIRGHVTLHRGEPLQVEFQTLAPDVEGGCISASAQGALVEAARTKEVTRQEVEAHIDRLGQTSFFLESLDVDLDQGVGIGFSQLHHVRKDALEKLEREILAIYRLKREQDQRTNSSAGSCGIKRQTDGEDAISESSDDFEPLIAIQASNPDCARQARRAGAHAIYVPATNYKRGQAQTEGMLNQEVSSGGFPKHSIPMIGVVNHDCIDGAREKQIDHDVWDYVSCDEPVFVESLSALWHALSIGAIPEIGPRLPLTNRDALRLAWAFGARFVWLSPELNLAQMRDVLQQAPQGMRFGLIVAGAQELMVTEHCVLMSQGDCREDCPTCPRRRAGHVLEDRKGYCFPVVTDMFGRSHVYNSVELDLIPELQELLDIGITAFMVDSTLMSPEKTAQTTGRLRKALELAQTSGESLPKVSNTTTGHLFRGVQ